MDGCYEYSDPFGHIYVFDFFRTFIANVAYFDVSGDDFVGIASGSFLAFGKWFEVKEFFKGMLNARVFVRVNSSSDIFKQFPVPVKVVIEF